MSWIVRLKVKGEMSWSNILKLEMSTFATLWKGLIFTAEQQALLTTFHIQYTTLNITFYKSILALNNEKDEILEASICHSSGNITFLFPLDEGDISWGMPYAAAPIWRGGLVISHHGHDLWALWAPNEIDKMLARSSCTLQRKQDFSRKYGLGNWSFWVT